MQLLIDFHFDFETRSELDLKKVGTVKYAEHPSTQATLLTWCFGRSGTVKYWRIGQPFPQELIDVAKNPHRYRFNAFNITFDYMIWLVSFKRQIAPFIVKPPIVSVEDTMALTAHFRVGNSLDAAAKILRLPFTKDKDGRKIMLKQCKINSRTGQFPELTEEEWTKFIHYGIIDTRLLRDIYYMLPNLPAPERYAFEWTFRRNLRGIKVDVDLIHALKDIILDSIPKLTAEFDRLVSGQCKINSPVRCLEFFKPYYPYIENMRADTIRDMLADKNPNIPAHVRRALEIKDLASSTAISKIKCAVEQGMHGRIYQLLAYHHAHTKRWAGRGIQIQNFPRVEDDEVQVDKIDFDLNQKDLASIVRSRANNLQDPIDFVKNLLRRIWLADDDKTFYCGDFSKVEPSVLYWMLGMGPIPSLWYEEMAATIYSKQVHEIDKDSEERTVGKSANLGCQYGMGWKKFKADTLKKTGILLTDELAKRSVKAFRDKYKEITQFWRDLETAFRLAIYGKTTPLCGGKVYVMPMQKPFQGVQIRLPSGSHLYYHYAHIKTEKYIDEHTGAERMREVLCYTADADGAVGTKTVYGGLLCEHVTSGTARDILVPSIWRLEQAGFDPLTTVHDELWGQAEAGRDEEFKHLMCVNPSWCDMVIKSDLKVGVRYLK